MKGKLLDLSISLSGKQRLTIELDGDFRNEFDRLYGKDIEVTVKQYRQKRSLDANAYAWVLTDKIASVMGIPPKQVYRDAIRDIGGVSQVVLVPIKAADKFRKIWSERGIGWQTETLESRIPGAVNMVLYYGSSVYDTAQMSALIESLVQEARHLGIETRPQEEIDSLLAEYERMEEKKRAEQDFYNGAAYEGA